MSSLRVKTITEDAKVVNIALEFGRNNILEDFCMISTHAAWFLAVKRLTALEYAVLFAAIGSAEFGGEVQLDKSNLASMLGAERASVSRAVAKLVEKQVLLDEGKRFGMMRYYRLNRYLITKGRPKAQDISSDVERLHNTPG